MFVKPFRTKSNVAIKGSDRKKLRSEFGKTFSETLPHEELLEIIPNKEEMTVMKLYSHKGENITAYCLKKVPVVFEHDTVLYPTIYTAWKHIGMLPCFTTQPQVFDKLHGGADLMLPGVIVPVSGLPRVDKGQVVAVNVLGNKAPLAIGYTMMSSRDMVELAGMRGKGIKITHTFGDHLWMIGDKEQPPQIPMENDDFSNLSEFLTAAIEANQSNSDNAFDYFENADEKDNSSPTEEEQGSVAAGDICKLSLEDGDLAVEEFHKDYAEEHIGEEDSRSESEIMDELLHQCFMTALKKKLKDSELPILTSTFYRTHVLPCCPANQYLDIKKTTYKKLGKYLKHVSASGLLQVKELTKGNDNIVAVSRSHPDLRSFVSTIPDSTEEHEENVVNTVSSYGIVTQKQYEPPEISVVHCVSSVTLPFFSEMGFKKGTPMGITQIRELITKYVKDHELVKTNQPRMVTLDPFLHRAMYDRGGNDIVSGTWEDVFKKVISKMQACHQLKFKGLDPIIRTGGPPSITISVQQRASNKKVTLVQNLESFLIGPSQFAESMRRKAQASTSITDLPGTSNKVLQQVLIQGNQVSLVESLLTGSEYKIPRKYLKGLENAPKSKKRGK